MYASVSTIYWNNFPLVYFSEKISQEGCGFCTSEKRRLLKTKKATSFVYILTVAISILFHHPLCQVYL